MNVDYALLTDLYQITMAQGYWDAEKAGEEACFTMYFRDYPFKGGYAVACGMAQLADLVETFRFSEEDIAYLASLDAPAGGPLFDPAFLEYLRDLRLSVDIDAVPEGTIVFPHEPLVRVTGPIMQCQLIETALLNMVNFQTLIATKAARVCRAAKGRPVAEFGLRRAQGLGGVWASRAAVVGGCASTSNVLAGKLFNIPVSGTHAHSWVMSFDDELTAFREYARIFPNNCILLVDTYDVEQGIRNAITVGLEMRERGERLAGIRIDSGDLSWLSKMARRMLDEAGLSDCGIVLSNDLDEYTIQSMLEEGRGLATDCGVAGCGSNDEDLRKSTPSSRCWRTGRGGHRTSRSSSAGQPKLASAFPRRPADFWAAERPESPPAPLDGAAEDLRVGRQAHHSGRARRAAVLPVRWPHRRRHGLRCERDARCAGGHRGPHGRFAPEEPLGPALRDAAVPAGPRRQGGARAGGPQRHGRPRPRLCWFGNP